MTAQILTPAGAPVDIALHAERLDAHPGMGFLYSNTMSFNRSTPGQLWDRVAEAGQK